MNRLETAKQKRDKAFLATVTSRAILLGYIDGNKGISHYIEKLLGCTYKTAQKRRDNPDSFTRAELIRLCSSLHLSTEERANLLQS